MVAFVKPGVCAVDAQRAMVTVSVWGILEFSAPMMWGRVDEGVGRAIVGIPCFIRKRSMIAVLPPAP